MNNPLTADKREVLAEDLTHEISQLLRKNGILVNGMMVQTIVSASKLVASRAVLKESK